MRGKEPDTGEREQIRIVLVDDHPESLSGMANLIGTHDDMKVVGAVQSGEAALALCAELKPDVAVIDFRMPGMNGLQAAQQIKRLSPLTQAVLVSVSDDIAWGELLRAGIRAFIPKHRVRHELLSAIRTCASLPHELE